MIEVVSQLAKPDPTNAWWTLNSAASSEQISRCTLKGAVALKLLP